MQERTLECTDDATVKIHPRTRKWCDVNWIRRIRDWLVLSIFVLQFQLIVGLSIYFDVGTSHGISNIFFSSYTKACLSALVASITCSILTWNAPNHIPYVKFTLPWAAPLVVGVTIASFQCDGRTWNTQYPILVCATTTYLVSTAGFYYFQGHLRFSATILKAALQSISHHPRLIKECLLLIVISTMWISTWCVALEHIYKMTTGHYTIHTLSHSLGENLAEEYPMQQHTPLYIVIAAIFGLLVYWTQQTCRNVIQLAVATAVGTWWKSGTTEDVVSLSTTFSTFPYSPTNIVLTSLQIHRTRLAVRVREYHRYIATTNVPKKNDVSQRNLFSKCNSLSFIRIGFFGGTTQSPLSDAMKEKAQNKVLKLIWEDGRVDMFLFFCTCSIAMISASLSWLLDSSNSVQSFLMGLGCGWFAGDNLLGIIQASIYANFMCVAGFVPDGNLPRTNLYFALRKELQQLCPDIFEEDD